MVRLTDTRIKRQIDDVTKYVIESSLSDDQNFAFLRDGNSVDRREIAFPGSQNVAIAMSNIPYDEIYQSLSETRSYNIKMLDGALIQMMYEFDDRTLLRHRLAFFPSPHLVEFQNSPDAYLEDELYAEIVARNIVRFPIRFDYDASESVHVDLEHPKSHLTLGQYVNCRIPVTAPLTPIQFMDFILRNFYDTDSKKYADGLPGSSVKLNESISSTERGVIHIGVPA